MKKYIKIMLAAVLLITTALAVSCNQPEEEEAENIAGDITDTEDETVAPDVTALIEFISGGTGEYVLTRPDQADPALVSAIVTFRRELESLTEIALPFTTDFERRGADPADRPAYEILIGETNREESRQVIAELGERDFAVRVIGNRLVIAGGSDWATMRALDYFLLNVAESGERLLALDGGHISRGRPGGFAAIELNVDPESASDVSIEVDSPVMRILFENRPLTKNVDYTVSGNTVTLSREMLSRISTLRVTQADFFSNLSMTIPLADPSVVFYNGKFYAYGTSSRLISSYDLVNWTFEGIVGPQNSWHQGGPANIWAPEVIHHNGRFYMYYSGRTIRDQNTNRAIGVAVSDTPYGPFISTGTPLWSPFPVIDAFIFRNDDGRNYLFASRQASGNIIDGRRTSETWAIELNEDMISVQGGRFASGTYIGSPVQPWETRSGDIVWNEAPVVLKHEGRYYLMISANAFDGPHYAVGFSVSDHVLGPFVKWDYNPVMSREPFPGRVSGPGHNHIAMSPDGREMFIVYHSHTDPVNRGTRSINIDRMGFRADGSIFVNGPTVNPQPKPSGTTAWTNIAREAVLTVSPTKAGYSELAPTDGAIGLLPRFERYEWVAADRNDARVRLEWETAQVVGAVLIYSSAMPDRKIRTGRLTFSDGAEVSVIDDIEFSTEPDMGAHVIFESAKPVLWLEFEITSLMNPNGEAGLSEIMVLGHNGAMGPVRRDLLMLLEGGDQEVALYFAVD